jgi:hypothetical protein
MAADTPKSDEAYSSSASKPPRRTKLSHDLFHGLSPEEFDVEAKALADAEAMTPAVRARIEAQLIERLKTPIDRPSWGPDWVRRGERVSASSQNQRKGAFAAWLNKRGEKASDEDETPEDETRFAKEDDSAIIMRNMEKSRQVAHYGPLYAMVVLLAVGIALLAMFVDYNIIRGDVWTRALSNEFMVVPASLQSSVIFKSLQVVFAVLIVHFFLKITGAYGRNALIAVAFVLALVMIGGLGYLVAYNNMAGATSAQQDQPREDGASGAGSSSIDALFTPGGSGTQHASAVIPASNSEGVSLGIPKFSQLSLANADSTFWLAFASVIFFIVTIVAALYMLTAENNVRNLHISRDYKHRQRQFAQLHMLQLADKRQGTAPQAA